MPGLASLLADIKQCNRCEKQLPLGVRPVLQVNRNARILIAGQAPGKKVHESGVPFDDASGERLRQWMGVSSREFYNPALTAILPMGFCYPGSGPSGDLPPRPECEPAWRRQLLDQLPNIELTLVLGRYAQDYHFGKHSGEHPGKRPASLTALVKSWQHYWPESIPLPHPSPRNNIWLSKNRWFEKEVLPQLQARIAAILKK